MKQLFSKFLVAFLLTSAVVLSWYEYFSITTLLSQCSPISQLSLCDTKIVKQVDYESKCRVKTCFG